MSAFETAPIDAGRVLALIAAGLAYSAIVMRAGHIAWRLRRRATVTGAPRLVLLTAVIGNVAIVAVAAYRIAIDGSSAFLAVGLVGAALNAGGVVGALLLAREGVRTPSVQSSR